MEKLKELNLSSTHITDAGLRFLPVFNKTLKSLNLSQNEKIDGYLAPLVSLQALEYLNIHSTKVTSESWGYLLRLGCLYEIVRNRFLLEEDDMFRASFVQALDGHSIRLSDS